MRLLLRHKRNMFKEQFVGVSEKCLRCPLNSISVNHVCRFSISSKRASRGGIQLDLFDLKSKNRAALMILLSESYERRRRLPGPIPSRLFAKLSLAYSFVS